MDCVIIFSLRFVGLRFKRPSCGGSVAKVKVAKESMIKSIHNIWIDLMGVSDPIHEQITINEHTVKLITNWNWINFLKLSIIFLPYFIAVTIDEKLLSIKIISLEFFAISVPLNIEKPTSLFDSAGASFVPSPVTATI